METSKGEKRLIVLEKFIQVVLLVRTSQLSFSKKGYLAFLVWKEQKLNSNCRLWELFISFITDRRKVFSFWCIYLVCERFRNWLCQETWSEFPLLILAILAAIGQISPSWARLAAERGPSGRGSLPLHILWLLTDPPSPPCLVASLWL